MTIGERIEALLDENGVDRAWLAKKSGKALSTISRLLNGKRTAFKEREAKAIAGAFGMTLESFLEGVEGMENGVKTSVVEIRTVLQYPATLTVERFSGKIVEDELDPEGNTSETRTLEIVPFQTVPSKVYFQEICSMQIMEGAEWRGVRVAIERPAYREEEAETIVAVIRDVKRILESERAAMILKSGNDIFGSAKEMREQ